MSNKVCIIIIFKIIHALYLDEHLNVSDPTDSNHTEEHVLAELEVYSELVSPESAIVVMDTGIEFAPQESFNTNRPWSVGSNPYTATKKFLNSDYGQNFEVDRQIEMRHLISSSPEGLLRRIR